MKISVFKLIGLALGAFTWGLNEASAAGFEKGILWSGRFAGVANAATPMVAGAESLFFNPAGLAKTDGISFSANLSPTYSQFSAPITVANTPITSNREGFLPFGILGSYQVTNTLGVGIGYYISGGNRTEYRDVSFPNNFGIANYRSNLTIGEASIGAGYEILDGLRVGASYRIIHVSGELSYGGVTNVAGSPTLYALNLTDLGATRWNGFRVGAQYAAKDSIWGIGGQWRSSVNFTANGTGTSTLKTNAPVTIPMVSGAATASSTFPDQFSVGLYVDPLKDKLRLLTEYVFTEYQKNKSFPITAIGSVTPNDLPLNWNNMNNLRLGVEYKGIPNWPLRAGYIFTSQVVPNSFPSPLFSTPGSANTLVAGFGATLIPGITGDFAFEYSWAKATVKSNDVSSQFSTRVGDYSLNEFAFHFGANLQI